MLEIPTPRWTTIQARKLGIAPPDVVPATVQERAWTSPIWYTPSAEARKARHAGHDRGRADAEGRHALDEAQLKALLVDKSVWVRNNVTGELFKIVYDVDGQSIVQHVGRRATAPSLVGDVAKSGYQGVTAPYRIAGGKIVTTLSQAPMEVAVYKLGEQYYAARSNEFGYANYQLLDKPPLFINPLGKGEVAGGGSDVHPAEPKK